MNSEVTRPCIIVSPFPQLTTHSVDKYLTMQHILIYIQYPENIFLQSSIFGKISHKKLDFLKEFVKFKKNLNPSG